MVVIFTMAGKGKRFKDEGFEIEKYQIKAKGLYLLDYALRSLKHISVSKYIFVLRRDDTNDCFVEQVVKKYTTNFEILKLSNETKGQADTTMQTLDTLNIMGPILIFNIDTYVNDIHLNNSNFDYVDGSIPCFNGKGDNWSFVSVGRNGFAEEVTEKKRISDNCSIGLYYFIDASLYKDAYKNYYLNSFHENTEQFIAPMYNYLIKIGKKINAPILDKKNIVCMGTPEELNRFIES